MRGLILKSEKFNENYKGYYYLIFLSLLVLVVALISIGIGAIFISPVEVLLSLIGKGSGDFDFIIYNYRLPRIILAFLIGTGLASSGTIIQGVVRNPLASPDVIGISKGASLAAAIVIILFPKSPVYALPLAAFLGAAIVAAILFILASKKGLKPSTLALTGIALGAVCNSGIQYLMVKFPVDVNAALVWLTGSLWGRNWKHVQILFPILLILLILAVIFSRKIDVLNLGDEVAKGLGEKVTTSRLLLLSIAVALAGASVAVGGSIGFIGLISPHMARKVIGSKHKLLIPISSLFGILILLIADSIGRFVFAPVEIPVGIVTAIIGAPYFLYLLQREKRAN